MNKEPRRIFVSEERTLEEKKKNHYTEYYVYDPDFLEEYKQQIIDSFSDNPELQAIVSSNMNEITEFIIGDRVNNGLSRLCCSQKQIHMDTQFADLTEDSFSLKPGCEYIETILVHELLHAASRKKGLTGVIDYLRDENGKVIGRKNVGLNEGITQYLAEQITGKVVSDEIDSYSFNKQIVGLLEDTLGPGIISDSYFKDPNFLKNAMNLMAEDPEYYDRFNKDLDTINKLQTTIRRIKNGSIKPKDPESLERMEAVLAAQQERLVESVFANVVIPAVQRQDKSVRQENLLPLLLKHEPLLTPVAKYVVKHHNSDWISDNILERIRKEINETGIDFEQIREASRKIVETKRTSAVTANRYMENVDKFYMENEDALTTDNSTKMTPLLRRELERMVVVLDQFELAAETTKLESTKASLEQYKEFLKKYFHKIPNLEEEIEKIRQERKNKKAKEEEPDELARAREAGRKAAEEATTRPPSTTKPPVEENQDKKEVKHPNLSDNFVIDNITGQVYKQENKTIFDKAVTIAQATGQPVDKNDEVLVELKQNSIEAYKASIEAMEPTPNLLMRYGDRWKEALLEAYSDGWDIGMDRTIAKATNKGIEERKEMVKKIKKGKLPIEESGPISLEEVETVYREIEVTVDENGNEVIVNRQTKQPIMSERTKDIAGFADEWVRVNGEDAFSPEAEETYNFIQAEIKNNDGILDIETLAEDAETLGGRTQAVVEELFREGKDVNKIVTFVELQNPNATQEILPPIEDTEEVEIEPPKKTIDEVLGELPNASLEEVNDQLNIYNGDPIPQPDGSMYHPFNDPLVAARLNARYRELNGGADHPNFVAQAPEIINGLLNDKEMLLEAGAYKPEYFEGLEVIKADLESRHPELVQTETTEKTGHK